MAIPDYQTFMLPLLELTVDDREHRLGSVVDVLADRFELSLEERQRLLPSGQQTLLRNRIAWACTYLKKAGLLESTRRGFFRISPRGRSTVASKPARIDNEFLLQFPEFLTFRRTRRSTEEPGEPPVVGPPETPEEALDAAYQRLRDDLEGEVLDQVRAASPAFFEQLVIDLLVSMGYGGSRSDAGHAVGRSGDGGIDGIIKEDRLGLDVIYIQAKRWEATVGRPEIQKFAGALQGQRARKGVFITTSDFSREALDFSSRIESKIILIDGATLAKMMIDHNVGVSPTRAYEVKRVDSDYFSEE